ncbi:MAG: DnaA regulatory inactivator Hda [Pseudomonadales bacterium]|nr:DnaA regulatory inactivator Hda [Pseudomonadales bacterium]
MTELVSQFTLGFEVDVEARFENYLPGNNSDALYELQEFVNTPSSGLIYLWASPGCGCSHLLQGATHEAREQGRSAAYILAEDLIDSPTNLLDNLAGIELVCIDNLEIIAGSAEWETALFHLFNRLMAENAKLVVAAKSAPRSLNIQLSDLKTRMQSGLTLRLDPLNDYQKMEVLQFRAQLRGMELSEKVAHYILSRSSRDMTYLMSLLAQLDTEGLRIKKKKLTIPFVKEILEVTASPPPFNNP